MDFLDDGGILYMQGRQYTECVAAQLRACDGVGREVARSTGIERAEGKNDGRGGGWHGGGISSVGMRRFSASLLDLIKLPLF